MVHVLYIGVANDLKVNVIFMRRGCSYCTFWPLSLPFQSTDTRSPARSAALIQDTPQPKPLIGMRLMP